MTLFDKQLEAYNSLNNFKIIQYGGGKEIRSYLFHLSQFILS